MPAGSMGGAEGRPYRRFHDAGLLAQPHETERLQLSPGERAEVVVAVAPGEETVLRSFAPDLGTNFFTSRLSGGDDTFDIVQLRAADRLSPSPALPDRLATIDAPDASDVDATRSFSLQGTRINEKHMDMDRVDEVVTVGSTEVWEVSNDHSNPHSFHPHLVHFSVLDVDGEAPPPEMAGWKDTVYVPPRTTIRIIARFDDHADPTTPYMFHCHVLAHEDDGMMGQFVVVDPATSPTSPATTSTITRDPDRAGRRAGPIGAAAST